MSEAEKKRRRTEAANAVTPLSVVDLVLLLKIPRRRYATLPEPVDTPPTISRDSGEIAEDVEPDCDGCGKHPSQRTFDAGSHYFTETNTIRRYYPACAQWCIFSIVRANFQKYDLSSAPIARALPHYIVPFFKFFKTGKCFKTMLFPVSSVSQKPLAFQKHSLLLTQPKTHAKTLSERSEKCATVQVLMGTDSIARAKCLQRALWTLRRALYQV